MAMLHRVAEARPDCRSRDAKPVRLRRRASPLRAARWIRESTVGQYDNFGPDSQREQQDAAIARWELVDSGLSWQVAASGWKDAWRTPAWESMMAAARAGEFDVLVVGYVSRFLRNLKQTLIAIEDHLHAAGVVVVFADERLLSSDPDSWDQLAREAHDAEASSRKQSKRVREGLAAKRRRLGVPGGNRPPYGYLRQRSNPATPRSPQQLVLDPAAAPVVTRAISLSASGLTDREVARDVGLELTHVREVLKRTRSTSDGSARARRLEGQCLSIRAVGPRARGAWEVRAQAPWTSRGPDVRA
jgi:DNA invertase Pin-like site-specific DNA recombinase